MSRTATRTATPQVSSTRATLDKLGAALREQAEAAHSQYPQYVGHWNGWRVAEVTRDVRTKMGVAFQAGDLVLVSPETHSDKAAPRGRDKFLPYEQWPVKTWATAYSFRNGIDTSVDPKWLREVRVDG